MLGEKLIGMEIYFMLSGIGTYNFELMHEGYGASESLRRARYRQRYDKS